MLNIWNVEYIINYMKNGNSITGKIVQVAWKHKWIVYFRNSEWQWLVYETDDGQPWFGIKTYFLLICSYCLTHPFTVIQVIYTVSKLELGILAPKTHSDIPMDRELPVGDRWLNMIFLKWKRTMTKREIPSVAKGWLSTFCC